jgi:hypothetical protein
MRFKISKADVALILDSRAFEEFEWVGYQHWTLWDTLERATATAFFPDRA